MEISEVCGRAYIDYRLRPVYANSDSKSRRSPDVATLAANFWILRPGCQSVGVTMARLDIKHVLPHQAVQYRYSDCSDLRRFTDHRRL